MSMYRVKLLVIIILMSVFSSINGQMNDALLEEVDFNDTTLVESDFLKTTLAEYIDSAKNPELSAEKQMYNYILATDNVLKRCMSFPIYKFVYQYLIYGFSELGANLVVDYMVRLPYLEYLNADSNQIQEMNDIAEAYNRVKIGCKAPDIHSVTVDDETFDLSNIKEKYVVILFWSYSCPHCRDLISEIGRFAKNHKDFAIVTVNVSGEYKKVKRLLKKSHLSESYNLYELKGWRSEIVDNYAVDTTPSMFLLDQNKVIIAKPFDIEEIVNILEL